MKRISCVVMICLVLVTTVQAYASEDEAITVTISPALQEQIQKANSDERKKIEAAIIAGNKFVPHHFDGSAYLSEMPSTQEVKLWQKNIRPLVDRDFNHWYSISDIALASIQNLKIHGSLVAVCPQIMFISISVPDKNFDVGWKMSYTPVPFEDDSFELKYQAKVIGALDESNQPPKSFIPDDKDEHLRVLVGLNNSNKVSRVISEYNEFTLTTEQLIDILTRYISGVWSGNVTATDKSRLEQLIQKIKDEETRVCGSTPN